MSQNTEMLIKKGRENLSPPPPSELSSRLALESSSVPAGGNGDENTRIPVFGNKVTKKYPNLQNYFDFLE